MRAPTGNDLYGCGRARAAVSRGDDVHLVVDDAAAEVAAERVLERHLVREGVGLRRLAPDEPRAAVHHEPVARVYGPPPLGRGREGRGDAEREDEGGAEHCY